MAKSLLGSKLFHWYPAEWIVTCLMLGKTNWCRRSWLTVFAALTGFFLGKFLSDPQQNITIGYAVVVVRWSLALLVIGWFSMAVYFAQVSSTVDEIIIDKFWGILLTLGLSTFAIFYVHRFTEKLLNVLCTDYMNCVDQIYFLGHIFGIILSSLLFFGILAWRPWPIKAIHNNMRGAAGAFLDDMVAVVYAIPILYLLIFLTGGEYEAIVRFFTIVFYETMGTLVMVKEQLLVISS